MKRLVLEDFAGDTLTVQEPLAQMAQATVGPRLDFVVDVGGEPDDYVALERRGVLGLYEFLGEWLAANR